MSDRTDLLRLRRFGQHLATAAPLASSPEEAVERALRSVDPDPRLAVLDDAIERNRQELRPALQRVVAGLEAGGVALSLDSPADDYDRRLAAELRLRFLDKGD
jgi:hypothetical protein